MSNFDLIFAYGKQDADDLRQRGLPHPKVRRGNCIPTTGDLLWALESLENASYDHWPHDEDDLSVKDEDENYWIRISGFDWSNKNSIPGEYFTIRGRGPLTLTILIKLCERCGQLFIYPDSGDPPIILESSMDAKEVDELHQEASQFEDSWSYFFEQMYTPR